MRGDWCQALPTLQGIDFTLREVTLADASPLLEATAGDEVNRFITPPPDTLEDFERFIEWARSRRQDGQFACFSLVPAGSKSPVGLFQIRPDDPSCETAEWGFVFAARTWGSGLFQSGAREVVDFVFDMMGVRRLEARAAVANGRGNGALLKLGAVKGDVVKNGFVRKGVALDLNLWSILERDWQRSKAVWGPKVAA